MKQLLLTWLALLAFVLAGCVSSDAPQDADDGTTPTDPEGDMGDPTEGDPEFCASEQGCMFYDDMYHEYTLYEVDTMKIDVLIVPPASPFATRDIETLRAAVDAWESGLMNLSADWFTSEFEMNTYVLGLDTPPQDAIDDPEIIVVAAEYNPVLLFGIGYQSPTQIPCEGETSYQYPTHSHHGMQVIAADCEQGGFTCVALNTNFLAGGAQRMYDLVAHEVGHCLGTGHVGDALDFRAKKVPVEDIMSYQYNETQVHCVSSLNARSIEGIYAHLVENATAAPLAPGSFLEMDPRLYEQVTCENPGA